MLSSPHLNVSESGGKGALPLLDVKRVESSVKWDKKTWTKVETCLT